MATPKETFEMNEDELLQAWADRDMRYAGFARIDRLRGVTHSAMSVRDNRRKEALAIGSPRLAQVAQWWTHPNDR